MHMLRTPMCTCCCRHGCKPWITAGVSKLEFSMEVQRRKTEERLLIKSSSAAVMASWYMHTTEYIYRQR